MRLVSLTVKDFRSITKAHKLHFGDSTVLIGPNNEGKSNILRALVVALRVLASGRHHPMGTARATAGSNFLLPAYAMRRWFDWETDFPIGQRKTKPDGSSEFVLEFELDEQEIEDFRVSVKSNLNGSLPVKVALGRNKATVSVLKKGPGGKALTAKSGLIADFLRKRIILQYIPAVRTAKSAHEVVDSMLESELQAVEEDPQYKSALDQIATLQEPILKRLSASIKSTLVEFLPAIKNVQVRIAAEARIEALRRSSEIIIDDGTPTHLKYKGDGVQSLAALALMKHSSGSSDSRAHVIIAVEEPESHLHPNAIHGLRTVLRELAEKQQIVVTTHCPLFVDRANIGSNILVHESRARSAKNIREIREILGVRASDNLRHAELVLLVEGEEDRAAIEALLRAHSTTLARALEDRVLALDALGGGSNLAYKASLIQEALCSCHCFLDDDETGRKAFEKARIEGLLTDADVNFSVCQGMADAELEDLIDVAVYETRLANRYRVSLASPKFRTNKKWSERMKETFRQQGKQWDDRLEMDLKRAIAELVVAGPATALNVHKRQAFDGLVQALEFRVRELSGSKSDPRPPAAEP